MFRRTIKAEHGIRGIVQFLDMLRRRHKRHAHVGCMDLERLSAGLFYLAQVQDTGKLRAYVVKSMLDDAGSSEEIGPGTNALPDNLINA